MNIRASQSESAELGQRLHKMAALHVDPRESDYVENEEELDADDWLFDSIKSYNHLHMYELQNTPVAIDFIDKEAICISCKKEDGGSEILELHIPDKLLAGKETLSKDRDFGVLSGGFHSQPITDVCCLSGTRNFITTEENSNSINLWSLGNEQSDMCQLKGHIQNHHKCGKTAEACVLGGSPSIVAFGSCLKDICVADVTTAKVTFAPNLPDEEPAGSLSFLDDNTLAIFAEEGQLYLMDTRDKEKFCMAIPKVTTSEVKVNWSCDIQRQQNFVRVNSQGYGDFGDIRNCKNLQKFQMPLPPEIINRKLQMHMSPHSNVISLSGLNGNIYLYDFSKITEPDNQVVPSFTHRGHSACSDSPRTVTMSTAWYPWQQGLIFSTADDGSLHAWDSNNSPEV